MFLLPLALQQYNNGFSEEFKYNKVAVNSQARKKDEGIPF